MHWFRRRRRMREGPRPVAAVEATGATLDAAVSLAPAQGVVPESADTPWTRGMIDEALTAARQGHDRAAMERLLVVLSVHPGSANAQLVAMTLVLRSTLTRSEPSVGPERLTPRQLHDPRLDSLFCRCEAAGCTLCWVSAYDPTHPSASITVTNPIGGRCRRCGGYSCRNHLARQPLAGGGAFLLGCPRCGGDIDAAPPPNGRPSIQTVRLNQPLIHVQVMAEGSHPIEPDRMTTLFDSFAPDVFEDGPTIFGVHVPRWPEDGKGLVLARLAAEHRDYLGPGYEVRTQEGWEASTGLRWAMAKVFANSPKHVDPTVKAIPETPASGRSGTD